MSFVFFAFEYDLFVGLGVSAAVDQCFVLALEFGVQSEALG